MTTRRTLSKSTSLLQRPTLLGTHFKKNTCRCGSFPGPGSGEVRLACLILPLTHPWPCNGTGRLQLEIAHNQSAGRHISMLLKRINVQCRGWIDGWQDSESIDIDMLFGITSSRHRPVLYFLCLCPMGRPALGLLEKKYLQWVEQGLWRTTVEVERLPLYKI